MRLEIEYFPNTGTAERLQLTCILLHILRIGMITKPVQRDAGQKLNGNATLHDKTRCASLAEMESVAGR